MDGYNGFITAVIFALLILLGSNLVLNLVLAVITSAIDDADDEAEAEEAEAEAQEEVAVKEDEPEEEDLSHIPPHRLPVYKLVQGRPFAYLIMAGIFANTVVLSMDRYPMTVDEEETIGVANSVFTYFFIGEMVLKLYALTPKYYAKDPYNLFDAFIVIMSIFELIMEKAVKGYEGSAISGLRAVRIFRVFKMAKEWRSLNTLLKMLQETLAEIVNFAILLILFMLIFALVGMQFFAGKMHFDDNGVTVPFVTKAKSKVSELPGDWDMKDVKGCEGVCTAVSKHYWMSYEDTDGSVKPKVATDDDHDAYYGAEVSRANFDDLWQSLVTIFQILTGENWNAAMYDGLRAIGWGAFIFYFLLIVIGMFFVMNIFLAILLSKFEGNDEIVAAPPENKTSFASLALTIRNSLNIAKMAGKSPNKDKEGSYAAEGNGDEAKTQDKKKKSTGASLGEAHDNMVDSAQELVSDLSDKVKKAPKADDDFALCCFGPTAPLRKFCKDMTGNPKFDSTIMVIILFSSITLAYDNPMKSPDRADVKFLMVLDYIFTIIFTFELLVKVVANGFLLNGPSSYLCNAWNRLDFIIVVTALLEMTPITMPPGLRAIRTIRVLRPIRMVARQKELRLVLDALLTSVPQVMNVMIVCVLFFLIFSVIFVNLYKGTFEGCDTEGMPDAGVSVVEIPPQLWSQMDAPGQHFLQNHQIFDDDGVLQSTGACYDKFYAEGLAQYPDKVCEACDPEEGCPRYKLQREGKNCITSYDICECLGAEWASTTYQNFNNVGEAMATLFEISTTEGWVDIMYAAVDATAIHMQPIRAYDKRYSQVILYIAFMLLGAFLFMNLFVGVIIERFNQIRDEMQATEGRSKIFMSEEQEAWSKTQTFILEKVIPKRKLKPKNEAAFAIVVNPKLDQFIMACIMLNSLVMGLRFFGASEGYLTMMAVINIIFAIIFTLEMFVKLAGLGWDQYWRDGWNKFDFVIVLGTFIGIVLHYGLHIEVGPVALIVRMVRMGRILRLINSAKTLKKLFNTLIASIPSLLNVCGLLAILMFVFAVLGVQMFATYAETGDINEHANFRTLDVALNSLFRFSTGENWNGVMHEMYLNGQDGCHPTDSEGIHEAKPGYPKLDRDEWGHSRDHSVYGWCDWGMTNEIQKTWGLDECKKEDGSLFGPDEDQDHEFCCRDLNGCGDIFLLRVYFYLFTLVVTFVMLNLAIGIILDAFEGEGQEDGSMLSEENLSKFVEDWSNFDQDADYNIKLSQLHDFFQLLDPPMGFGEDVVATDEQLLHMILSLDLVIRESNVTPELGDIKFDIQDVAQALGRRVCKLDAERKRDEIESEKPIVLEAEGEVPPHMKGISHSPATDVIRTYWELTYGVVSGAAATSGGAAAPPPVAPAPAPPVEPEA